VSAAAVADSKTIEEEKDLEAQEWRAHIDGIKQDADERKLYAKRLFWLMAAWLAGIFLLLLAQGFLYPRNWFDLSENVLLAAIGTTTVNIIGMFVIVARYLFPKRDGVVSKLPFGKRPGS